MSYFPSIVQNIIPSSGNSSTANLAGGATFTGTSVSTLGISGIQVMLKTDQNCTVFVEQSSDQSNWDISDSYSYNVIKDKFGITVQAISAYARVRVKNENTTTTTTFFRLNTVLCPIVEAIPRSLDSLGNLKTAVDTISDKFGYEAQFTPMRDLKVAQPYRLVGTSFGTSIDTNFWTATNTGTGSASGVATGFATLTSGTANSGFGQIQTVRSGRFVFANPHLARSIVRITALSIANNTRSWGAMTATAGVVNDGYYFSLSSTNVLSVNTRNNGGTVNSVASGSFNGTVSEYTMNTNAHAYEIMYFLGSASFFIDDVLIHTFTPTTSLMSLSCTLPFTAFSVNSAGGTSSGSLELWAGTILRMGRDMTSPLLKYIHGASTAQVLKTGAGRLNRILFTTIPNGATITLYDALTATNTIMIITPPNGATPFAMNCDLDFYTGLTVTTVGATTDVTFVIE